MTDRICRFQGFWPGPGEGGHTFRPFGAERQRSGKRGICQIGIGKSVFKSQKNLIKPL